MLVPPEGFPNLRLQAVAPLPDGTQTAVALYVCGEPVTEPLLG